MPTIWFGRDFKENTATNCNMRVSALQKSRFPISYIHCRFNFVHHHKACSISTPMHSKCVLSSSDLDRICHACFEDEPGCLQRVSSGLIKGILSYEQPCDRLHQLPLISMALIDTCSSCGYIHINIKDHFWCF